MEKQHESALIQSLGLNRFLIAQERNGMYERALAEIRSGRKVNHWIWYICPQMVGLGHSRMSNFYGIQGRAEAEEYVQHPLLRQRLVEVAEAILENDNTVYEIFGGDAIKVKSCYQLFASVCDEPAFRQLVAKYQWN